MNKDQANQQLLIVYKYRNRFTVVSDRSLNTAMTEIIHTVTDSRIILDIMEENKSHNG